MDAKNVPSRAKNVRCPKDIYLMAEEVMGLGNQGRLLLGLIHVFPAEKPQVLIPLFG